MNTNATFQLHMRFIQAQRATRKKAQIHKLSVWNLQNR